jgi:hypothetical protein
MAQLAAQCGVPAAQLIWAPVHCFNVSLIPEAWRWRQRPAEILAYNAATSAAARAAGLQVFDTYNMTVGAPTLDGVHMTAPVTALKVQALLARLDTARARGAVPA